jgi:hypothetical protein
MLTRALIFSLAWLALTGCRLDKSDTTRLEREQLAHETEAIANTILGFYHWYEKNEMLLNSINFIDESGSVKKLHHPALDQYFAHLSQSKFISQKLIEAEKRIYLQLEELWSGEQNRLHNTTAPFDRFYCTENRIAPYYEGHVKSMITEQEAVAILTLTESSGKQSLLTFHLVKEADHWLISALGCTAGMN